MPSFTYAIRQKYLADINAVVSNYPFLAGIEPEKVGMTVFSLATRTTITGDPVNVSFTFETDPDTGLMLVCASSSAHSFPGYTGGPGSVSLFCVMNPLNPSDTDLPRGDLPRGDRFFEIGSLTEQGALFLSETNPRGERVSVAKEITTDISVS